MDVSLSFRAGKGLLNHRLSKLLSSVIGKRRFYNGR